MQLTVDDLPPEILSTFFVLAKRLATQGERRSSVARVTAEVKALIELSRVCKRWRQVILGDGTLWTDVPADAAKPCCQNLLRTVLQRSKQSTISVTASLILSATNQATVTGAMGAIADSSNRIEDFTLDIDSTLPLEGCSSPAPALRKLRINNRGPCAHLTMMFSGHIPQLESLTLSGFTGCPVGFLGNLKHLALKLPLTHPPILTTAIVTLLEAAPKIESLSLVSFISVIDDSSPSRKAVLPQLQSAFLRNCDTVSILPRIIIPEEVELHISVDHRTFEILGVTPLPTDNHILFALPSSLEAHLFLPTSPKLTIELGETLNGFAIALTSVGSSNPCLKISECSGRVTLDFVRRSLEAISRHAYLKTARNVAISIPPTVPGVLWSSWLGNFAFATQLSVRALPPDVVLHALMKTDEGGLPVCPCLKRVGFHVTEFNTEPIDPRTVTRLFLFRAATGFPLERVVFMESGLIKDYRPPAWLSPLLDSEPDRMY